MISSLDFGAAHAILFQLALIPLTMARYSIAHWSGGGIHHVIPLELMPQVHAYLGYWITALTTLGLSFCLTLTGVLCAHGTYVLCAASDALYLLVA